MSVKKPMITIKEKGFWNCNGHSGCGGSDYNGIKNIMRCFHCYQCKSYVNNPNHWVVDNRIKQKSIMEVIKE